MTHILYDFGAVSVTRRIPRRGPLSKLLELGDADPRASTDIRRRAVPLTIVWALTPPFWEDPSSGGRTLMLLL